ncbi:NPP1 protein [Phytophthora cinnamomi]|uniref:NPP1 protein n=1 Tax=Phytophthora cinnamomi TaxID=4785 RepID=UPI00355A2FC3|nr:NPP1 protein [Phytophthora cinnamomi]
MKRKPPGRSRVTGTGRKEPKHTRDSFTKSEKLEIVRFFANNKVDATLDKYFPKLAGHAREQKRKLMYQWRKEHDQLEELCADPRQASLKYIRPTGSATILPTDAEMELVQWINALRKDGAPVSSKMLELQARATAHEYEISPFEASWHWRKGFMKRHRLSIRARTRQGQVSLEAADTIAINFAVDVQQKMLELRVTKVYNADQTVWIRGAGKDKERFTVMLLGDSDGTKYPLYVVLKSSRSQVEGGDAANWKYRRGFGIHVWNEARQIMAGTDLQLYANPTAWWNADIHMEFIKGNFGSRPQPRQPILLLVDDFSGHWTAEVKAYAASIDVHLMKVPPSCTAVSQPADIAWNRPFKSYLRTAWVEMLREQLRAHTGQGTTFKMKAPGRSLVCKWIQESWSGLSRTTIQRGFSKAHLLPPIPPSNAMQDGPAAPDVLDDAAVAFLREFSMVDETVGDLSSDDDLDSDDGDEIDEW